MTILQSVHTLDDVVLRVYMTRQHAVEDKPNWVASNVDSGFIGFRLLEIGADGKPTGVAEMILADG